MSEENAIKNSVSLDVLPCTELESLVGEDFEIGQMDSEHSMDPKKLKRMLSNRASAKRSRLKQLQYISIMESRLLSLQVEVSFLLSEITRKWEERDLLSSENLLLKQQIIICGTDSQFLSAQTEEYQAELGMLKQLCVTTQDQSIGEEYSTIEEDYLTIEEEQKECL